MTGTACAHFGSVGIKYACVMGFSVFGEEVNDLRINLIAIVSAGFYSHADAAVGLKRTFEGLICLESHNRFLFLVQISGTMGSNGGNNFGVHIQNSAGFPLLLVQLHNLIPQLFGVLSRAGQEGIVAVVRGVVCLNKVADIDFAHPYSRLECSPLLFHISYLLRRLKLCVTLQDGGKSPIVLVLNSYNYIEYK